MVLWPQLHVYYTVHSTQYFGFRDLKAYTCVSSASDIAWFSDGSTVLLGSLDCITTVGDSLDVSVIESCGKNISNYLIAQFNCD